MESNAAKCNHKQRQIMWLAIFLMTHIDNIMPNADNDFANYANLANLYVIAMGSNRRHTVHGLPRQVLVRAIQRLSEGPAKVVRQSSIIESRPIGPSQRSYANNAIILASNLQPLEMLDWLKNMESEFGTRHRRRWTSRTLDLDIILWREAFCAADLSWHSPSLTIPHCHMRERDFVLGPVSQIAGSWRDPVSGLRIRQLHHRLKKPLSKS